MSGLRRHPLIRADISEAINWYEDQQPGLGLEFAADFLFHYRLLSRLACRTARTQISGERTA